MGEITAHHHFAVRLHRDRPNHPIRTGKVIQKSRVERAAGIHAGDAVAGCGPPEGREITANDVLIAGGQGHGFDEGTRTVETASHAAAGIEGSVQ